MDVPDGGGETCHRRSVADEAGQALREERADGDLSAVVDELRRREEGRDPPRRSSPSPANAP